MTKKVDISRSVRGGAILQYWSTDQRCNIVIVQYCNIGRSSSGERRSCPDLPPFFLSPQLACNATPGPHCPTPFLIPLSHVSSIYAFSLCSFLPLDSYALYSPCYLSPKLDPPSSCCRTTIEKSRKGGFGLTMSVTRRGDHVGAHNFSSVSKPTPRHFPLFPPVMRRVAEQCAI